ncbi:MAG: type II toxin-antitoxin system prevent-host-death family antitoxin [Chloroflexi bacterium]|nr:type II toxin-antitoxin system prevent-host-death family antitoxin [Chloroflexota bacterium]
MAANSVTTYGIREFKARISEILKELDAGSEVVITRRGEPCARLVSVPQLPREKPSLASLRGALSDLPDAIYEDFREIKAVWEPRSPPSRASEQ